MSLYIPLSECLVWEKFNVIAGSWCSKFPSVSKVEQKWGKCRVSGGLGGWREGVPLLCVVLLHITKKIFLTKNRELLL